MERTKYKQEMERRERERERKERAMASRFQWEKEKTPLESAERNVRGNKRQKKALRRRGSYKIVVRSFTGIGAGNYVYVPPRNLFRVVSRV